MDLHEGDEAVDLGLVGCEAGQDAAEAQGISPHEGMDALAARLV